MSSETSSKILRVVPREKAFYFFTSIGNYTGTSAASLKEFMEKVNEVNAKSLEFHLYRADFEKWIAEVLEDAWLAGEVRRLQKSGLTGEPLRNQLYLTVSRRFKRLTSPGSPVQF
ncbi:MAG: DUF5752 family protein [Candidatus Bathyarchaeia archaeon]|jgi:hypothetical protein